MSFLDNIELLKILTKEERESLNDFCQERFIKKWEVLFNEGDEANAMYILKTGTIGIYKDFDGQNTLLWTLSAEDILWEMALFKNGVRMAKAVAMEDTYIITILSFSIKALTKENPVIMQKIDKVIREREEENMILEGKVRKK